MADRPSIADSERWQEELERLWAALETEQLLFFPVRHHSPACAWHLEQLIRRRKPACILLEGPAGFTSAIPHLVAPETRAPVALYTQFIDRKRRTLVGDEGRDQTVPPRYGAFLPLCDYSPELVALREGHAVGARLVFFDLDFPQQVLAETRHRRASGSRVGSLLDESHLVQSAYLGELARRRRCRDTHELWDRLFECDFQGQDTGSFIRNVATYCFFARVHTADEELEGDGTLARERFMARRLKSERQRLRRKGAPGPLLVVTGGFHTAALALGSKAVVRATDKDPQIDEDETLRALVPYSFKQLDALHGYAAGMPSPFFYQRLWELREQPQAVALEQLAREMLVELPRRARLTKAADAASTADSIGALQQARSLASFRGHPGPLREDVLDGVRSCFVQGELDAAGALVLDMALELMRGDAVGAIRGEADELPIITDFTRQAEAFSLRLDTTTPQELALKVYRKSRHRRLSQFLRRLEFLEVPFARFISGPDFVAARGLDLQVEHWTYAWNPQTSGRLVECSLYGASVEDAVVGCLEERIAKMREQGGDAGAQEAVALLTICCTLGLHAHAAALIPHIQDALHHESSFAECAAATSQLELLRRFRGPLEAEAIHRLPDLLACAYHRCCHLLSAFERLPEEAVDATLDGLSRMRELLVQSDHERDDDPLDADLFWSAVRAALDKVRCGAELQGGMLGLAYSAGLVTVDDLLRRVEAGLAGCCEHGSTAPAFLRGLFTLCREITWQSREVMQKLNDLLRDWGDDEFYAALPLLRLAFSGHTPQETDQVARLLSEVNDGREIGELYQRDVSESDLERHAQIAAHVFASLEDDRLLGWTDDEGS